MTRIALVVLDTVRRDVFNTHFSWLRERGTTFENAYSNSHWTVPAHAALFTGESPVETSVHHNSRFLDTEESTLAEELRADGFTTRMLTQNSHISPAFDFDRGFDSVFETSATDADPIDNRDHDIETRQDWWLDWQQHNDANLSNLKRAIADAHAAERPTGRLLASGIKIKFDAIFGQKGDGGMRIKEQLANATWDDDEFVFVNLMEAHQPYKAPPEYRTVGPAVIDGVHATFTTPETPKERLWQAYVDEVRYLSELYRSIHDQFLADDFDYVFTVSDHGELFGEGNRWEHQCGLEPDLVRIPAVVSGPECPVLSMDAPITLRGINELTIDLSRGRDFESMIYNVSENSVGFGSDALCGITEYHGQDRRLVAELEQEGYNFTGWTEPMYGLIYPNGYAFPRQGDDELSIVGDVPETVDTDHETVLSALPKPVMGEETNVSDDVEDRLRQLGYTN